VFFNLPAVSHALSSITCVVSCGKGSDKSLAQIPPSVKKGRAVPLQAWSGPEVSRKLGFPDFMTTAQDGGKVVNLTHRPPLPPGDTPGTHFCYRLSRPQGHSAILCQ